MAYSEEEKIIIIDTICENIEKGMAFRDAIELEGMPNAKTFYAWIDDDNDKLQQYARATELRAEKIFEEILTIADNQEDDVYKDKDGIEIINHNVIQRARLRVDSRKWMVGKLSPKKYGDKIAVDLDDKRDKVIGVKIIE